MYDYLSKGLRDTLYGTIRGLCMHGCLTLANQVGPGSQIT